MKIRVLAAISAAAIVGAAGSAQAALVDFLANGSYPSNSFADGTFSSYLSGGYSDGFYAYDHFSAYNAFGQNNEFIQFNAPVTLNSLFLGRCTDCFDTHPAAFTVNLYDAASVLIGSKSINGSSTGETLNFDTPNVKKIEFTFSGTDGSNPYSDGRAVAWYDVGSVSYTLSAVPEPAVWALMIGGFGIAGATLRRRRARTA